MMLYMEGQPFSQELLRRIQDRVDLEPELSRRALSRKVCEWLDWRSVTGKWQEMSCRKALAKLNRQGLLRLPEVSQQYSFQRRTEKESVPLEVAEVQGTLKDLGEVTVELVRGRQSRSAKTWSKLMSQWHSLGNRPLRGAQLRYLIKSSTQGYVGALGFCSACWKLKKREKYIGWTEEARRQNLLRVVNNARLLIVPTVQVPNLGSHALALATTRLGKDWEKRYGVRPVLMETFVDPERFRGTIYRAANWKYIGKSAGRRDGVKKKIFVYPLVKPWRKVLCTESVESRRVRPMVKESGDWAEQELGSVRLYDPRLRKRLFRITGDFYHRSQANIPEACGSQAATMGAYRFFQNEQVSQEVVLAAHREATVERMREHPLVLAPNDTTFINYSAHPMTEGLGPLRNQKDDQVGILLHDTLAFTPQGTPLGVLDAQFWVRDPVDKNRSRRRKDLTIEEKESMKWLRSYRAVSEVQRLCPQTTIVSVGDRESDLYELFREVARTADGAKLLVRACKGRERRVNEEELWEFMARQEAAGTLTIHLPRRENPPARFAHLEVRFAEVSLAPPKDYRSEGPIRMWAVDVREVAVPVGCEPVEWLLLTTVAVKTFEEAQERIEWYTGRWGIEVYHRTLKSGCRIKDRQLSTEKRLENCLAVDMIVAWRIYHLTMLGRETPDVPCTAFFKEVEWKALYCYKYKTKILPDKPPTLQESIMMLASLGGHLGRKRDGFPGTQTLWRGLQRLDVAVEMYAIFTEEHSPPPSHSGP